MLYSDCDIKKVKKCVRKRFYIILYNEIRTKIKEVCYLYIHTNFLIFISFIVIILLCICSYIVNKDLWLGNFLLSISTGMFASFFVLIIDRGIKKNDTIKEYEKEILGKQLEAIKALSNYCDYIHANYEILNKKDIMNFSLLYEDFCNDAMPKTMSITLNENGEILRYKENYCYIMNEHKKICLDNDTTSLYIFVKNTAQEMETMQDITSNLIWEYDKYFESKLKRLI